LLRKSLGIYKEPQVDFKHINHLEVISYSGMNFTGYVDTKKSTSGYFFLLAGGVVSWKSTKQTIAASSTMKEEFITCYEATT
jgi:hypothetical protein